MDSKGFFLGLIAAVVLFLLWKKEQKDGSILPNMSSLPGTYGTVGCTDCGGPSAAAAPVVQGAGDGFSGQISPGTPPLNSASGAGSFYAASGPTPNTGFLSRVAPPVSPVSQLTKPGTYVNVPSSPTTPSDVPPIRSVQRTPSYQSGGFVQRYNVVGVPRPALRQSGWLM